MMQMGDVQLAKEKPVHGDLTGISPLQGTDEKDAVNVSIIDEDKVVSLLDPSKSQSEGQIYDDNKSRVQDAEQIALEDSSRKHPVKCYITSLAVYSFPSPSALSHRHSHALSPSVDYHHKLLGNHVFKFNNYRSLSAGDCGVQEDGV